MATRKQLEHGRNPTSDSGRRGSSSSPEKSAAKGRADRTAPRKAAKAEPKKAAPGQREAKRKAADRKAMRELPPDGPMVVETPKSEGNGSEGARRVALEKLPKVTEAELDLCILAHEQIAAERGGQQGAEPEERRIPGSSQRRTTPTVDEYANMEPGTAKPEGKRSVNLDAGSPMDIEAMDSE